MSGRVEATEDLRGRSKVNLSALGEDGDLIERVEDLRLRGVNARRGIRRRTDGWWIVAMTVVRC